MEIYNETLRDLLNPDKVSPPRVLSLSLSLSLSRHTFAFNVHHFCPVIPLQSATIVDVRVSCTCIQTTEKGAHVVFF